MKELSRPSRFLAGALFAGAAVVLGAALPAKGTEAGSPAPQAIQNWLAEVQTPAMRYSSGAGITDSKSFFRIIALGPPGVKHVVAAMRDHPEVAQHLQYALHRVTNRRLFTLEELRNLPGPERVARWLDWWERGRKETPGLFEKAYAAWTEARAKGETVLARTVTRYDPDQARIVEDRTPTDLGKAYTAMLDLGVEAVPLVMEHVKAGDMSLLPLVSELTRGNIVSPVGSLENRSRVAISSWEQHRQEWLLE